MPNRLFRPLSLSELTATQQSSAAGFIPLVQAPLAPGGGIARPVNFTNEDGDTQLHLSSRSGDLQGVEELLTRRADPNAQNKDDDRPLHLAAEFGNAMVCVRMRACVCVCLFLENKHVAGILCWRLLGSHPCMVA